MMKDLRAASLSLGQTTLRLLASRHPGWVASLVDSVRQDLPGVDRDDDVFIQDLYQRLLGRVADPDGRAAYMKALAGGMSRADVVLAFATSDEYRNRCRHSAPPASADAPRVRNPLPYRFISELSLWTFEARGPSDFDWLEDAILRDGYYEHPGVWGFEVDTDKRVMAEIVGSLSRGRVLELGCANGAVLEGLYDQGLSFEGVDISQMALERASERVRSHIHQGDLLSLDVGHDFDTVFGLDIFEHLNPNRLTAYLERLSSCLLPGGVLFANIPAFGQDEVFGQVFAYYLRGWDADAAAGRCFQTLHVDEDGYPINGHLIWADTRWWVEQFEAVGFVRRPAIESALHEKYGQYLIAHAPARRSFYVFSMGDCPEEANLVGDVAGSASVALAGWEPSSST